ncbi:MAG TPA: O-antigen ligase family protein [Allosphingosinicella sp.]|nr:O-antigen ligase family protein [Allosphingosinicella sp.]
MRINFFIVCVFFGAVAIFGGASRADVMSLPLVRLASVVMIAIALMQIDRQQWRMIHLPVIFLLAVAAIIAVQLIPLPPQLWASLPGRGVYMDALGVAGIDGGWRAMSLTPDLTLNALLALLPPIAAIFALCLIGRAFWAMLIPPLLIVIGANALLGVMQIASNTPYFYSITNDEAAVGFFSNRNHYAVLLAIGFPCLACWAAQPQADPALQRTRLWLALCAGAALFPLLLTAGSRAGLILGGIGAISAFGIRMGRRSRDGHGRAGRFRFQPVTLIPVAVGAIAVLATIALARDEALNRLLGSDTGQRGENLSIYFAMAKDFLPFGSGFGSFDSVFRAYEPLSAVTAQYLNQAHNDLLQIVIEGGVLPVLLLAVFLVWYLVRNWALWRHKVRSPAALLGRTGAVVVALILLSSLVDYPLRTPWLAVLMAAACCWMLPGGSTGEEKDKGLAAPTA